MIGGEFIIIDPVTRVEHIVPNRFTIIGIQQVLKAAFWNQDLTWQVGLCNVNPSDTLQLAQIGEPEEENGYVRQSLPLNNTNWPTISIVNGESYVETRLFTFP